METTANLINRVKAAYNLPSNYAIAKKMGVSHQCIANYVKGRSFLDTKSAFIVAELLNMEPAYIVACASIERSKKAGKENEENFWLQYA
jgi:hypothetical protein